MTEYQTHSALVATLEAEIVRLRAVNAGLAQAARQALEALSELAEWESEGDPRHPASVAITALREALEAAPQPPAAGQEPIGFMNAGHLCELESRRIPYVYVYPNQGTGAEVPIYTAPHPAAVEQEPVAHLYCGGQFGNELDEWEIDPEQYQCDKLNERFGALGKKARIPLYTAPQPARQPLTDEQIDNTVAAASLAERDMFRRLARAIERALGIGGEA